MGAPSPSSGRTAWVAFLQACVRGKDWPPEPVADGPAFVQSGPTTLEGVLSVWAAASSEATSRALGDAVLAIQEEGTSTERRAVRWRVGSPKPIPWRSGPLGSPGPAPVTSRSVRDNLRT